MRTTIISNDKKIKCDYIIEVYADDYNTLRQSIIYPCGDARYKNFIRSQVNPNLPNLIRKEYYREDKKNPSWPGKLIREEKFEIKRYSEAKFVDYEPYKEELLKYGEMGR